MQGIWFWLLRRSSTSFTWTFWAQSSTKSNKQEGVASINLELFSQNMRLHALNMGNCTLACIQYEMSRLVQDFISETCYQFCLEPMRSLEKNINMCESFVMCWKKQAKSCRVQMQLHRNILNLSYWRKGWASPVGWGWLNHRKKKRTLLTKQ